MATDDKEAENLFNLYYVAMGDGDLDSTPLFTSLKSIEERYKESDFLAAGGMKRIYRVFDAVSERYVALAKLHEDAHIEYYDSFIREARLTAKLEHPNIMTIHDIGVIDGEKPYFTMELKNGGSLEDILQKRKDGDKSFLKKYPREQLLNVFLKVCDAMSFAHSKGVIHLDLKPANIQVGDFGEVLVCDWGLGKVIGEANDAVDAAVFNSDMLNDMTLHGHIKGTPGYMAPEQIKEDGVKGKQTDIYALGCILYTILTDECPVSGETAEKLNMVTKGQIEDPQQRAPTKNVPLALSAVTMKAMSLNSEDRYESVENLGREVHKYISGFATQAEEAGIAKQISLFWQRNKQVCSVSLLSMVLIGGVIAFSIFELKSSRDAALQAQFEAEENLTLYKQEKKNLEKATAQWSSVFTEDTWPLLYQLFFSDPQRYLNLTMASMRRAVQLNPGNEDAQSLIGFHYFMVQRFHQANEAFAKGHFTQHDLKVLSLHFSKLKEDDEKLLSEKEFNDLMYRLSQGKYYRNTLSERMLFWDQSMRTENMNYSQAVKWMLLTWNERRVYEFHYNDEELVISGQNFSQILSDGSYGRGLCLASYLPLRILRLHNTSISDAEDLKGLDNLEVLDIRGTTMKNFEQLNLRSLQEIIVTQGQLTEQQIKNLSGRYKVTTIPAVK